MERDHVYAGIVSIVTVALIVISSLYLPAYFRERGDLYTSFEYAQMYLNDDDYSDLLIEYNYVEGYPPSHTARSSLISTIFDLGDKDQITDTLGVGISIGPGRSRYSSDEIRVLFDEYNSYDRGGSTMVLNVLYLDGEWYQESNVLGLSFGGDKIVVFMETILSLAQRSENLNSEDIETSVLIHEFGHILGLVGIGYESGHEDEDYPHHCDESAGRCVMSASVEVKVGAYTEPPPKEFCSLCLEDLDRIRVMEDDWGIEEYLTLVVIGGIAATGIVWVAVYISKDEKEDAVIYQEYYNDSEKKRY